MKILALFIALISLTTIAAAYDYTLNEVGYGWDECTNRGCWRDQTGDRIELVDDFDNVYFQLKSAGSGTLHLYADVKSASASVNFSCGSVNYSQALNTLTTNYYNFSLMNTSANVSDYYFNTNTGLISCAIVGGTANSFNISKTNSYVTFGTTLYPSFSAGVTANLWSVNKYYNSSTNNNDQRTDAYTSFYGINMVARNNSGLNLNAFSPSCDLPSGNHLFTFDNRNETSQIQTQRYYETLNITALSPLEIDSFTYPENSSQLYPNDVLVNLSVVASDESLVDWIVWYIDGAIYGATTGTYSIQIPLTKKQEPYHIEVQLEDNDCGFYPTIGFYAYVGQYINLTGITYGRDGSNVYPLWDVQVTLNDSDTVLTAYSNANGTYFFPLFEEGTYTLYADKPFWTTHYIPTYTFEAVGDAFQSEYGVDFVLNRSPSAPIYNYNLVCVANTTQLDIVCCVTTNNPGVYYLSAVSFANQFAVEMDGTMCVDFVTEGKAIYCGQKYDMYIGGIGSNITDSVVTQDCAATTTTTTVSSTTTTTLAPPTLDCTQGTGNDTNCCVTGEQESIWITYSVPNESVSGGHTFNNTGGTGFCFSVLQDLNPSYSFCDTLYDIWIVGYYDETSNQLYTNQCNGNPPTTTSTTTTTTLIAPGCNINHYDIKKDCVIDETENNNAVMDWLSGTINLSCVNSINYYYANNKTIPDCSVTVTTVPYTPPNYTTPEYNCSNQTGMIMTGDIFHASVCSFTQPLGTGWFYGLTLLLVIIIVYLATKTFMAAGIISLLWSGLYYTYLPKPSLTILAIGVGLGIALTLLDIFTGD